MLGANFIGAKNEEFRAGRNLLRLGNANCPDDSVIRRLDRIGTMSRREHKLTAPETIKGGGSTGSISACSSESRLLGGRVESMSKIQIPNCWLERWK